MNELLTWLVVVSSAGLYLRAYDETDQKIIDHTGETKAWAKEHLTRIVNQANAISANLSHSTLPGYLAPSAKTAHYAARLADLDTRFINVLTAGILRIDDNE